MRFFWVGRFGLDVSPGLPLTTTHPARGDDLHHRGRLGSETTAAPRWGAETWMAPKKMGLVYCGVHHKNLVTWENRAPKDWQVASPLVM